MTTEATFVKWIVMTLFAIHVVVSVAKASGWQPAPSGAGTYAAIAVIFMTLVLAVWRYL